jgi:pimeloyl-ACP methyl ester carboxylesterase
MKHVTITGGGGTRLHLVEAGNPHGQAILLIHGFSQCWLAWSRQLDSDLATDHRIVAMDLRGHGSSERPRDGYDDSKLWADDVDAVIRELELDRPILCGWSYGPFVILDYVRRYGEQRIGGMQFVDGITQLGSDAALSVLTPEFLALVPAFFSSDVEESVRGLGALLELCTVGERSESDAYTMLGYQLSVPPFVRRALLSRIVDNDDLLPTLRRPVLLTHGARDAVVKPEIVRRHHALIAHARIDVIPGAGHACFRDDPASFNRRLRQFSQEVADAVPVGSTHGAPNA